ncbi:hypothetical protein GR927_30245 [Mycolicibacterium sp. 3033]|nr:hypothetical protein [Mycolicibacterium aurantiacum]
MTVEDYQLQTEELAARTAVQVASINAALQAGDLTVPDAEFLIASVVDAANNLAALLADQYVSVMVETATGTATPSTGVSPTGNEERLKKAVSTVLTEDDEAVPDVVTRLQRLARSEPLETGQRAVTAVIADYPHIEGWTRHMDGDPCQLCRWWWREGRIWPKEHPFQRHKGCNCQPKIVVAENIQSTIYTRRLERERAATRRAES